MSCGNFWPPKETTPPTPMLTDAERECLVWAEDIAGNCEEFDRVEVLRGLLERLGGER